MAQSVEERKIAQREANKNWRKNPVNKAKHQQACVNWAKANPEKVRKAGRESMARLRQDKPAEYFYKALKARAKDGRSEPKDFNLTIEFLEKLLEPMVCSKTGMKLFHSPGTPSRKQGNPWAPSIDRIESSKGYTQDNVQLVCWAFNMAKGPWEEEVFKAIALGYLEQQHG